MCVMQVAELRRELEKRKLDCTGLKPVLIKRLKEAIESEADLSVRSGEGYGKNSVAKALQPETMYENRKGAFQSWEPVDAESRFVFSLDRDKLQFVDREDAVNELMAIHRGNFNRACDQSGECFYIPLCDHVIGLGKSEFGRNYIRKCREIFSQKSSRSRFEDLLCNCHTIHLTFALGSLVDGENMDQVLMALLELRIGKAFARPPPSISKSFSSSDKMLLEFTKENGPIFIVLDAMGNAFERAGERSKVAPWQRFLRFCDEILCRWFLLDTVLFLVLGRAGFLSYVSQRPEHGVSVPSSKSLFKRLPLRLLKISAIKVILTQTLYQEGSPKTIAQHFELDDSRVEDIARYLFAQTNGHPRQLLRALKECNSYEQLSTYVSDVEIQHWDQFCQSVNNLKSIVLDLLRDVLEGKEQDMTKAVLIQGKSVSFDEIASYCLMAWEGTIQQATIYALPWVISLLKSLTMPFRNFLQDMIQSPESIPLDYPDVFEILVMKRFQELFIRECSPRDVLSSFFDTAKFGGYARVSLSSDHIAFPKNTKRGQKSPSMTSSTASSDALPKLLKEMDIRNSICLKPAPQSSLPDIIFVSNAWENFQKIRLRICIAAKNYHATELSEKGIDDEIQKANHIFSPSCATDRNILFICCTNYSKSVTNRFSGSRVYCYNHGHIDEIIVLDLTTAGNRGLFFGVSEDMAMSAALEEIIKKTTVEAV